MPVVRATVPAYTAISQCFIKVLAAFILTSPTDRSVAFLGLRTHRTPTAMPPRSRASAAAAAAAAGSSAPTDAPASQVRTTHTRLARTGSAAQLRRDECGRHSHEPLHAMMWRTAIHTRVAIALALTRSLGCRRCAWLACRAVLVALGLACVAALLVHSVHRRRFSPQPRPQAPMDSQPTRRKQGAATASKPRRA